MEEKTAYEAESEARQAEFELADVALQESIKAMKNEHAAHIASLLEEHTAIVEKMKAERVALEAERAELKQRIVDLTRSLAARDPLGVIELVTEEDE